MTKKKRDFIASEQENIMKMYIFITIYNFSSAFNTI